MNNPCNLDETIEETIERYVRLYDHAIKKGVKGLVLSKVEGNELHWLSTNPGKKLSEEQLRFISAVSSATGEILSQGNSHYVKRLDKYKTVHDGYPNSREVVYFVWYYDEYEQGKRKTATFTHPFIKDKAFGMRIRREKRYMSTEQADTALVLDHNYDCMEGFESHLWVYFKDGNVFNPTDADINEDELAYHGLLNYHSLDDAIRCLAEKVLVPSDLLKCIIVNSNLSKEEKAAIGLNRELFWLYPLRNYL